MSMPAASSAPFSSCGSSSPGIPVLSIPSTAVSSAAPNLGMPAAATESAGIDSSAFEASPLGAPPLGKLPVTSISTSSLRGIRLATSVASGGTPAPPRRPRACGSIGAMGLVEDRGEVDVEVAEAVVRGVGDRVVVALLAAQRASLGGVDRVPEGGRPVGEDDEVAEEPEGRVLADLELDPPVGGILGGVVLALGLVVDELAGSFAIGALEDQPGAAEALTVIASGIEPGHPGPARARLRSRSRSGRSPRPSFPRIWRG